MLDAIVASGITRNISLKLTQLGLDVDREHVPRRTCGALSSRRSRTGSSCGSTWRTRRTSTPTLDIFETLWREGYTNSGVVLQSALHRSEADLRRVNALGARVRLVKGAYKEPADVAWQRKADVDAAFIRMMELLLREGTFPALATHDPAIIAAAQAFAATHGIARTLRVPDAVRHPARPADRARRRRLRRCAYTFRSAVNGFPITCAGSENARQTSASCSADSSRNGNEPTYAPRFCSSAPHHGRTKSRTATTRTPLSRPPVRALDA